MLVTRVQPEFIRTKRIDPDYYRPEHLADEKHLQHFGSDELGTVGHFVAGPFGSKLPSDLYLSAGIPLFRVGNVGSMEVLLDGMAHLAPEVHEELRDSEVIPGDLLIVKASVGEKICRVPASMPRANITQHIIGIRPNGKVDMDYVAAFLFCQYGRRQLVRRSLGSIIQYLGITDSKDVLFPRIKSSAQLYVGDKVRQAERLREAARIDVDECKEFIRSKCTIAVPPTFREAPRRVTPQRVSEYSLGPDFTWAMEGQSALKSCSSLQELIISCSCGEPIRADERMKGLYPYYGASGPIDLHDEYNFDGEYLIVAQDGSIGLACVARDKFWANNHVWILAMRPEYDPDLIALYLTEHYPFWKGIKTGSVVPKVTSENLLKVVVPNEVATSKDSYGAKLRLAVALNAMAKNLSEAARFLVEALVEGKATELELISAQEALERGDDSPDRALLRRLTRQGIDVPDQPPLFPDLDALYTLLAECSGHDAGTASSKTSTTSP